MRLFVTGGTGVLGRALVPLALAAGHDLVVPRHAGLNLFDPGAVHDAVDGADAVLHLATRVRELDRLDDPAAWFYPPDGPTSEDTPIGDVAPTMRSALVAERETQRQDGIPLPMKPTRV